MRLRRTTVHKKAVHTVTDARRSMSEDISRRQKRYVIHMGIRTLCIILAVAVPMPMPLRVIVVAAAILVPYFAVVFANGGREPERPPRFSTYESREHEPRELPTDRREIG